MKKTICILLIAVLLGLCGCSANSDVMPGAGEPDVTAGFDWSAYDALIEATRTETDLEKRSQMFHQAEELVMQTGAVLPLTYGTKSCVVKADVSGVYQATTCEIFFDRIRREGVPADEPLQICICGEPMTLDPILKMANDIAMIAGNTSAGLLRENAQGQYECVLAERYEISDDGKTYTFHLRPDLKWSDGAPLTAEDFAYAWKRATAKETAAEAGYLFDCIRGYPEDLDLTVSDNGQTLTVVLAHPCAYFLSLCAKVEFGPAYRKQVEGAEGYKDENGKVVNPGAWASEGGLVSCGAYYVKSWTHNESIVLEKNPYYFKADEVPTQTINLMLTSDTTAAYNAYVADSVVLIDKVPEDIADEIADTPEFHSRPSLTTSYIAFNVDSPLFEGMTAQEAATFRRALGFAVDREFLCAIATSGRSRPAVSVVPPNIHDGTGKTFGEGYEYDEAKGYFSVKQDLGKAREMLESIGFRFGSDGELVDPITVDYLYNPSDSNAAIAACLQADFAELGIHLNLVQMEWNVFLGERRQANAESFRGAWTSDFDDPYGMLNIFTSDSANNDYKLGK